MKNDERQECTALVKSERKPLSSFDRFPDASALSNEEKIEEVIDALRRGVLRDPITTAVLGMTAWHALGAFALSAGLSVASMMLGKAFTPKHDPIVQGALQGEVSGLMSSSAGQLIPEIYSSEFDAPVRNVWMIRRCN